MITEKELANFRAKANKALEQLAKDTGFKLSLGAITFAENTFTAKLTAVRVHPGDTQEDIERRLFAESCWRYGLIESDFGKTFRYGGKVYQIVGIKAKAKKNTILIKEIATEKLYVFPHQEIQKLLDATR